MKKLQLKTIPLFLALCLAWCPSAQGQMPDNEKEILSDTEGFFIEGHFQGHGLTVEDSDADSGGGLGVKVGYGFTPLFTLYLGIDGASMDVSNGEGQNVVASEYTLVYVDLGGRINLRAGPNSVVPYLDGSLSGIGSVYDTAAGEATFSGAGVSIGGGVQYFFSPQFAFNGGLDLTFGSYDELELAGQTESVDLGITGARINIGFSWYPFSEDR